MQQIKIEIGSEMHTFNLPQTRTQVSAGRTLYATGDLQVPLVISLIGDSNRWDTDHDKLILHLELKEQSDSQQVMNRLADRPPEYTKLRLRDPHD